ncbi:MAG: tetratricopeptide repeat protein, partial [Myxococcota bacterium]
TAPPTSATTSPAAVPTHTRPSRSTAGLLAPAGSASVQPVMPALGADAAIRLGRIASLRGDPETAAGWFAAAIAEPDADRGAVGDASGALGDLHRQAGRFDEAERAYAAAVDGLGPNHEGGDRLVLGLLNLAILALERGDPPGARRFLAAIGETCGTAPRSCDPLVDVTTAGCAAELGDWDEAAARLIRLDRSVGDPVVWQPDTVWVLARCRDRALAAARSAVADHADRLAREVRRRLG